MVDQRAPVTLLDVAKQAGVSLATASRALNANRNVREDLSERVLAAAAQLNYSVNAQAQAMARGRTNVIGLLVHDIADPYFSSVAGGVMLAAERHQLLVTLANTMGRPERELEYLAAFRAQRSRAVILAGSRVDDLVLLNSLRREITAFQSTGGRVAVISRKRLTVDTVIVENWAGARSLAQRLVELGYERFAILAGPRKLLTARDRCNGFRAGLTQASLPAPHVVHGDFTRNGGYEAMLKIIKSGIRPGCVFAVNDVMAVGAMAACREQGWKLPDDLAMAGFDDIATLRDIYPGLTTVKLPLEEIGSAAVSLVISEEAEPRQRVIMGEVVIRDSTPGTIPELLTRRFLC